MRTVEVTRPSFPDVAMNSVLDIAAGQRWQVVCGDEGHWRAGVYSPGETSATEVIELEQHDCPELFLLLSGRLTLVLREGGEIRELPLEPMRPVFVTAPHCGFCPDGPHTGTAFVVERDAFKTEYGQA